jgi:glycosyltransferase involved in cell wall biosynthesis
VKILLVAPEPFYQERGTPIAVKLLAEQLCALGHQVDLLVYHEGTDVSIPGMRLFRATRPPGVRRVPIGISWQKLVCDAWLVAKMIGLLRRNRYNVIHAVEEAVFPAALVSRLFGSRLVYDMDSSMSEQVADKWKLLRPVRRLMRGVERLVVRRSALVLAVCEDLAAGVRPWVGADRVVVLPDVPLHAPVDPAEVDDLRAACSPETVLALYVGNLERYQGIDLLVQSLGHVDRGIPLRVVLIGGSTADIRHYRAMAEAAGIADRVHFLGARPVQHLSGYLAQADILLSPRTMGRNTPMKIYSYMQAGKAILATDIRSHTQALDATCAHLVEARPEAVARGLEKLAGDSLLRARLGEAARTKAEREYSLPVFASTLRRAYESLQQA